MFKKINAIAEKKIYWNFNGKNEKVFPVDVDGFKNLDGHRTESMSNFTVTSNGNYIGGDFLDVCVEDIYNPALGFFLKSKNKITLDGKALTDNIRQKITEKNEIIIYAEEYNCLFYPIIEDSNEYYLEYSKEDNSVGIISVYNGTVKAENRIINKFGCAFSMDTDFIKDNADIKFFSLCSINRVIGYNG